MQSTCGKGKSGLQSLIVVGSISDVSLVLLMLHRYFFSFPRDRHSGYIRRVYNAKRNDNTLMHWCVFFDYTSKQMIFLIPGIIVQVASIEAHIPITYTKVSFLNTRMHIWCCVCTSRVLRKESYAICEQCESKVVCSNMLSVGG